MTHDSHAESSGVSRRTFLGAGAAAGAVAYLTLLLPHAEAALAAATTVPSETSPPERPHRTLLGVL